MNKTNYLPPWDDSFTMDGEVRCAFCRTTERPILVRGGEMIGICEPCASICHYRWKQQPGDVPPGFSDDGMTKVSRVYVLIPRMVDQKAEILLPANFEFVMCIRDDDGSLDLPGEEVVEGETLQETAVRALRSVEVATWPVPDFLEHLYTAYTPRGRLAAVMLVTAWRRLQEDAELLWKKWPISSHETPMKGFYRAMETVWSMRVFKHNRSPEKTSSISVQVNGAASQFIRLQQGLRAKTSNLDTSLMEIYRKNMSDDELEIEKRIASHEINAAELASQKASEYSKKKKLEASSLLSVSGDDVSEDDPEEDLSEDQVEAEESDDSSDDEEAEDDSPPDGFVRRGKPLDRE